MLGGHEIAQLDRLALGSATATPAAAVAGLRHARARGYGLETADHRPYRPGDDPRQIDWNSDARLRQLSVRVLKAEGEARVHLVIDTSASMRDKLPTAVKLAAALAYLTVARRDVAGLSLFDNAVSRHLPGTRGRAHLHQLFSVLESAAACHRSEIGSALRQVAHRLRPPAFVIVLSDFFVPGFGLDGLAALSARGLDPAVIQLVAEAEAAPTIATGDRLVDLESDEQAIADRSSYLERFAAMTGELRQHCLTHGMPWLQLRTPISFPLALARLIEAGILAGRR